MKSAASLIALAWLAVHLSAASAGSPALDQLERSVRRPQPAPPRPTVSRPGRVWVPDRHLHGAGGTVHVPGHWERRVGEDRFHVPPLVVCDSATGQCSFVPAGVRGPAETRQSP